MKTRKHFLEYLAATIFLTFASLTSKAAGAAANHYSLRNNSIEFHADATDEDMVILDHHPELKFVALGGAEGWSGGDPRLFPIKITDAGFAHVALCTNLEELHFSMMHPVQVTDDSLKSIEGLKHLRIIQTGETQFHSAALSHISGLSNLEELWFDGNRQFDDASMEPIANLKKLRVLRFYGAPITDAGLAKIKRLSQLEVLLLSKAQVGDAGLKVVEGFTKLKNLDLQHTHVTDAGMEYLKPLTMLTWLCLDGTAVGDKGISCLSNLTNLQYLFVDGTKISKAALDQLSASGVQLINR